VWPQGSADTVCPRPPLTLTFDRLTLKLVCELHLRWGTFLPNLGRLGLLVLKLFAMYARQTDRWTDKSNAYCPLPYGRRHNNCTWMMMGKWSCWELSAVVLLHILLNHQHSAGVPWTVLEMWHCQGLSHCLESGHPDDEHSTCWHAYIACTWYAIIEHLQFLSLLVWFFVWFKCSLNLNVIDYVTCFVSAIEFIVDVAVMHYGCVCMICCIFLKLIL